MSMLVTRRTVLQALPAAMLAASSAPTRAAAADSAVSHRKIAVNGITLHIAEQGQGPLVILCHGWPESWASWRHQMKALAAAGYHAVAPDMRGFGDSDAPEDIGAYSIAHTVGDMAGLVTALGEKSATIVGHDWGAPVAWAAAQLRPDLFTKAIVLSIPFAPRGPTAPLQSLKSAGVTNYYWQYFQTPGVAEAELEKNVDLSMRAILYGRDVTLMLKPGLGFLGPDTPLAPRPDWLSEEDIGQVVATYSRTGFRGGLNWYRNIDRNWEISGAWDGLPIRQPVLFIAGEKDIVLLNPRVRALVPAMAQTVPGLRKTVMIDGAGHWIQRERPAEVNAAMIEFLRQ